MKTRLSMQAIRHLMTRDWTESIHSKILDEQGSFKHALAATCSLNFVTGGSVALLFVHPARASFVPGCFVHLLTIGDGGKSECCSLLNSQLSGHITSYLAKNISTYGQFPFLLGMCLFHRSIVDFEKNIM